MKHYWLIIKSNSVQKRKSLELILRNQLASSCLIHPDEVNVQKFDESTLIISLTANLSTFGYKSAISVRSNSTTLVEGLPTLEKFNIPPTSDSVDAVSDLFEKSPLQELYQNLGGVWSVANVNKNSIKVLSSFCGYMSCYYYADEDIVAVGNCARLVSLFNNRPNKTNWKSLSWIASTTMMMGHETAFNDVYKIPPGDYLTIDKASLKPKIRSFTTNYFTPLYLPTSNARDEFMQDTVEKMCNRVNWYLKRGIKINSHLTGGKDSRMILSLLLGSGTIGDVNKIQTTGEENNGDVIVARLIAESCGLNDKHFVKAGNKSVAPLDSERLAQRFFNCASMYEGQLTPFDGMEKELPKLPTDCPMMGGGGEIYRNKMSINLNDNEATFKTLLNAYCNHDKLNLLTEDSISFQSKYIEEQIKHYRENRIINPEMKFYIDQRLSNWGQGHFRHGGGTQIPLLIDFDLARFQASNPTNKSEDIHFDIIRYSAPELLKIPFLNQRWGGTTRDKAANIGVDIDPIEVQISKSFPWQFDAYPKIKNICLDYLLDNFDGFSQWLSRDAVVKLRRQRVDANDFNSADIKIVFGLSMAAMAFNQDLSSKPSNWNGLNKGEVPKMNETAIDIFRGEWQSPQNHQFGTSVLDFSQQIKHAL